MSKMLLLVESPSRIDMTTSEWPHNFPSPPTDEKKTILFLSVMCAHAATRGGFLPITILSFSFGVSNLHGADERSCNRSSGKR